MDVRNQIPTTAESQQAAADNRDGTQSNVKHTSLAVSCPVNQETVDRATDPSANLSILGCLSPQGVKDHSDCGTSNKKNKKKKKKKKNPISGDVAESTCMDESKSIESEDYRRSTISLMDETEEQCGGSCSEGISELTLGESQSQGGGAVNKKKKKKKKKKKTDTNNVDSNVDPVSSSVNNRLVCDGNRAEPTTRTIEDGVKATVSTSTVQEADGIKSNGKEDHGNSELKSGESISELTLDDQPGIASGQNEWDPPDSSASANLHVQADSPVKKKKKKKKKKKQLGNEDNIQSPNESPDAVLATGLDDQNEMASTRPLPEDPTIGPSWQRNGYQQVSSEVISATGKHSAGDIISDKIQDKEDDALTTATSESCNGASATRADKGDSDMELNQSSVREE